MALTPEQEAFFAASFAKTESLEAARRKRVGEVVLCLDRAPDDPPVGDEAFQAELRTFANALRASGLKVSQRAFTMDSADVAGYPIPEFILLFQAVATPVAALCGAWLQAKFGRKVRLKIGDIEAEGRSVEEIEALLERAKAFQKDARKDGDGV